MHCELAARSHSGLISLAVGLCHIKSRLSAKLGGSLCLPFPPRSKPDIDMITPLYWLRQSFLRAICLRQSTPREDPFENGAYAAVSSQRQYPDSALDVIDRQSLSEVGSCTVSAVQRLASYGWINVNGQTPYITIPGSHIPSDLV